MEGEEVIRKDEKGKNSTRNDGSKYKNSVNIRKYLVVGCCWR
jgi:hypothetical protein